MKGGALRIGEAAERAGISPDTLRYYERVGVLPRPARTDAGYRQYSESSIERIHFVRKALLFGFSLKQIAAFLRARESGRPPCREVRAAAGRLVAEMDRQIAQMTAARSAIRRTLSEWDRRLARTPPGAAARLLDALPSTSMTAARGSRSRLNRRSTD